MNFDSALRSEQASLRYPDDIEGIDLWKFTVSELPSRPPVFRPVSIRLPRPRLFVSYKSQDRQFALRLAYLADLEGFEYWLDVLNPVLAIATTAPSSQQRSVLIATTIEIGLLNSTHLIAAITANTAASRWVPYEYGRVKTHTVVDKDASSWLHSSAVTTIPEYLYLCPIHDNESAVRRWLISERSDWEIANRKKVAKPAGQWTLPIPPPLP